jgi:hypothetical protein
VITDPQITQDRVDDPGGLDGGTGQVRIHRGTVARGSDNPVDQRGSIERCRSPTRPSAGTWSLPTCSAVPSTALLRGLGCTG